MAGRTILHIDFDSFFASCEQQFNPAFRGKPLGVTAHNGRTAIIAASREAKARGVTSPSRTFEAQRICPDIIFTSSHFVEYWEISKKFLQICKDYSPFVELFSLDEVFMDVTETAHLFKGTYPLIQRIKDRIRKEIGEYITVSVGISYNKLLAKLASGLKKPNGICEITPENRKTIYSGAKLTDVCGIGERIRYRLNKIGIYTLLQLEEAPLVLLLSEFGTVEGHFLKNVGYGKDSSNVIPYTQKPEVKSVGRNYCLPRNEYDKRIVLQNVYELCEEVAIKLRRLEKKARGFGVSLRGSWVVSMHQTFHHYFDSGKELFDLFDAGYSIKKFFRVPSHEYIRQISVWVWHLEDKKNIPQSLFEYKNRRDHLMEAVDQINEKYGHHTVRNGFLLYADKLTTVPNGFMADKYERMKLASS